jgi:RES domain-containing protein
MHIYRLTPVRYAQDMSGTGAKLYGGRWNHKGIPCLYAAESRALCVVEFAVHVSSDNFPGSLTMVTYSLPNKSILTLEENELPSTWRAYPSPDELKDLGSRLLKEGKYMGIRVPSSVVPQEYNYFLNPIHKDFERNVELIDLYPFEFDQRIKE